MKHRISVIVPVYKVEPYLRKCVDSIRTQTYSNLEIILVDDGSPDGCPSICDDYAAKDPRVKVIHKKNGGLSDARNAGLDICSGDYIAFVDSDDWIEPTMYESLLSNLKYFDADMAFGGVADELEEEGNVCTLKVSDYGNDVFCEDNQSAMKRYFHGSWAAWDKLYKAFLFDEIRFPVGEINEDEAIVLQLLEKCNRVCYTNEVLYHYMKRVNSNSITTAAFSEKKLDWVKHCRENYAYICENHPELILDAAMRYRNSILWALSEMALSDKDFGDQVKLLKQQMRKNMLAFFKSEFKHPQDRIRLFLLLTLPYIVYKKLLKVKRKL